MPLLRPGVIKQRSQAKPFSLRNFTLKFQTNLLFTEFHQNLSWNSLNLAQHVSYLITKDQAHTSFFLGGNEGLSVVDDINANRFHEHIDT